MDEVVEQVGKRLRQLRRARRLTLAELADRSGLSDGYLSNVEQGTTAPRLSTLATLAAVLGSDMSVFFPPTERSQVHVHRAADRDHLRVSRSSAETYTVLSARTVDPSYTGLLDEIEPTDADTTWSYFGERLLLVRQGEIEMRIGPLRHRLTAGDTLHYSSHPEHSMAVTSPGPALVLWVVTPAIL